LIFIICNDKLTKEKALFISKSNPVRENYTQNTPRRKDIRITMTDRRRKGLEVV